MFLRIGWPVVLTPTLDVSVDRSTLGGGLLRSRDVPVEEIVSAFVVRHSLCHERFALLRRWIEREALCTSPRVLCAFFGCTSPAADKCFPDLAEAAVYAAADYTVDRIERGAFENEEKSLLIKRHGGAKKRCGFLTSGNKPLDTIDTFFFKSLDPDVLFYCLLLRHLRHPNGYLATALLYRAAVSELSPAVRFLFRTLLRRQWLKATVFPLLPEPLLYQPQLPDPSRPISCYDFRRSLPRSRELLMPEDLEAFVDGEEEHVRAVLAAALRKPLPPGTEKVLVVTFAQSTGFVQFKLSPDGSVRHVEHHGTHEDLAMVSAAPALTVEQAVAWMHDDGLCRRAISWIRSYSVKESSTT